VAISSAFYAQILQQYFGAKKCQIQNVTRENLRKAHSYKKLARKMLMKSTPGTYPWRPGWDPLCYSKNTIGRHERKGCWFEVGDDPQPIFLPDPLRRDIQ